MHIPSLSALEYHKILELLAEQAAFSTGRSYCLSLQPATDPQEVRRRLAATSEAVRLMEARRPIGVGGAHDVRPLVEHAEREGLLDPMQFLEILSTLQAADQLRRSLERLDRSFPMLQELIPSLYPLPPLQQSIQRCIDARGEVLNSASQRLGAIRSEIRVLQGRLGDRMQSLLKRYSSALQETIITQRQGRYVLAVKTSHKRAVPGLVHDHSASGATLFIEPMEVVDMGNTLRELELEEEDEVRRVLMELSDQVAASAEQIDQTVETLARTDLILAKARFSLKLQGGEPGLVIRRDDRLYLYPPTFGADAPPQEEPGQAGQGPSPEAERPGWPGSRPLPQEEPPLRLVQARHPLLPPELVVPIDVHVGGDFRVLVITGPNTGGKTVSLKTVGLLTLMAQAGLHIPAGRGSHIAVMDQVFADIGDEQSIEQNLSTFSSHMTRIIQVLEQADQESLVLLDELGAGTDPVEGTALARALIEELLRLHCLALTTTHHSELKSYAYTTPHVENASVEFDVETLSPTYILTIGLPGRSNALAIAGRLGLDRAIIDRAQQWLGEDEIEVEALLEQIQQEREETQQALAEARQAREHAHNLERRLEREIRQLKRERHDILEQTRRQAETALEEVRERVSALQRDMATVRITREWMDQTRQRIEETEEAIPEVPPAPAEPEVELAAPKEPLEVGDAVWVESLGAVGEVLTPTDEEGEVEVQVGSFKVQQPADELRKAKQEQPEGRARTRVQVSTPAEAPPMELELRGRRAAEVEPFLDRYLNDAYLTGMPYVRIIHGKGTGALRRVVREILAEHPLIRSFKTPPERDGGEGVTVAHLIPR